MTPIQPENSDTKQLLQQWLKDADVAELNAEEQVAIRQLLAELQGIPSASVSPRLDGRLQSLSQWQTTPSSRIKRFLALLSAGLATAAAVLVWQSNGLKLQVAQQETNPAAAATTRPRGPEPTPVKETPAYKEFLLTSSQNPAAEVKVIIQPGRATNLLAGQGLPQLQAGQIYRLWAQTALGPQGCIAFMPDANGNVTIQVPREPSASAISLMVSIDRIYKGSSPEQPGKPVLMSI